ncbi:hypothetical protein WJX84_008126 [Apatococcus fuscideae]|uniref:Uncharacterized protein n=1 Tax=Apatococcus fuscideae TaxID=2026836 RepID=A0AAW1T867_9CHLO
MVCTFTNSKDASSADDKASLPARLQPYHGLPKPPDRTAASLLHVMELLRSSLLLVLRPCLVGKGVPGRLSPRQSCPNHLQVQEESKGWSCDPLAGICQGPAFHADDSSRVEWSPSSALLCHKGNAAGPRPIVLVHSHGGLLGVCGCTALATQS